MRVRHKPPALVSMWMLDVFCCALGCVTLLFLLNSRLATDAAKTSQAALAELADTDRKLVAALGALDTTRLKLAGEEAERGKLAAALAGLEAARAKLADEARTLGDDLRAARAERDAAGRELADARAALAATEKKADATAKDLTAAKDLLAERQKELDALAKRDEVTANRLDVLQKEMTAKEVERDVLDARLAAAKKELSDVDAKLRSTQRELDAQLEAAKLAAKAAAAELAAAKSGAAKAGEELGTARARIKDLSKKVEDATATIIDLQGDKAKLADKYNKFQKESEARFAGIAMTGKRVVFAVDMSGSMGKRDLQNLDPTKWPLVVETVCKVMRSIPTLERYQVVVFSSSARWLLGDGGWQEFDGEKSVAAVEAALLKVKPVDDTNVYAALEKAFSLRPDGLDTVYLFSDGLPTSGPGLTPAQQRATPPLSETELGTVLGKYVRDTLAGGWNRPEPGRARVRINTVGFYFESVEVGAFLWALARDNDGSFVGMSRP